VKDAEAVVRLGPEALKRSPEDVEVLGRFVSALLITGRKEDARPYMDTLMRLAPTSPQTQQLEGAFRKPS
jgi:hypothetical protein